MRQLKIHARLTTSDYDGNALGGTLFDEDARLGTFRAYRAILRHIRQSTTKKGATIDWRTARKKVRPALKAISQKYWRDYDYDERKKSAAVKAEAKKLIAPLSVLVDALRDQPLFVRHGLNAEAKSSRSTFNETGDYFESAMAASQALLEACQAFNSREHRKAGGVVRYKNACRELAMLWEHVFEERFPRNAKLRQTIDDNETRCFESRGAEFVYVALHEIGNRWVHANQVEEALRSNFRGGK